MAILYESYTESPGLSTVIYGTTWEAQTFTPALSHSITSVQIFVRRTLNPGTVTVNIESTSSREPTGIVLATGTFDGNGLTGTSAWQECTLTAYDLIAGTLYTIVVKAPTGDSSNYVSISMNRQSNGDTMYTNVGSRVGTTNGGTNWTVYDGTGGQADDDHLFRDYGFGVLLPTDAITRVTNIIHRYNRAKQVYSMEVSLGEVTTDFGLPEWAEDAQVAYTPKADIPVTVGDMDKAMRPPDAIPPEIIGPKVPDVSVPVQPAEPKVPWYEPAVSVWQKLTPWKEEEGETLLGLIRGLFK